MSKEFIKRLLSSLALVPLVLFFVINGAYYFIFFILVVSIISIYEWYLMSKNKAYKIPGIIFLIFSFYTAYYLRNEMYGDYLYFIVIIFICISTDIGGYTFGKIFKGPKLTKISPKKTYAGVIGGYFCSIIFMALFLNYADYISVITNTDNLAQKLFVNNFILTILISTVSQIGDIIISYFKRKSKIKNTGKIIPGHGGLLDRIDGMIFVFPLTFFIFKIL